MPDWTASMQQSFEYYIVDPGTWKDIKRIENVVSCTISRDSNASTLGSASVEFGNSLGECYVRAYLITVQNGIREKHPIATFLVQTLPQSSDGKTKKISADGYTPLIELKEKLPPFGYSIMKGQNIMDMAYRLCSENLRAPVVKTMSDSTLSMDFVSEENDTWLTFLTDLMLNARYTFSLDEMGRVLFLPKQDTASLQPVYTFDDSNSSILYPEISLEHDLYGIPNVVEVMYSNGGVYYYSRVINDDPNSPISTVNRGREIIYRETSPELIGVPTEQQISEYARQLLRDKSALEYTINYTHGYCPVRIGDCVRINSSRAGFNDVKAKVIKQSIECRPGCPVTETAVFTTKLWE